MNAERPDGSVVTPIGWLLISVGIIGVFIAATAETLNGTLLGFGLANLGIGLGVVLLSLGYLVRAIWFLPGRNVLSEASPSRAEEHATESACEWCGRTPASGKACSKISAEALARLSPQITNPTCKEHLRLHGYEPAEA